MANNLRLYALIFLVSLLAACGENDAGETVVLITETAVSPTIPSPTTTYTPTPSPTQTAVPTKPPTATATATTIPTLTPLPTFAPDELETAVADLLANPMNCDVPCWWGAKPNETTFFEIYQFLELHQLTHYMRYLEQESPNDRFELRMGYNESTKTYDFRVRYGFTDNVLTSLISEYAPPISNVLEKYGMPDEIWLSAMNDPRQKPPLMWFVVVYFQKGLGIGSVIYGDVQDDVMIGCFSDGERGLLHLVPPNRATSYKDLSIYDKERLYLPLEEATDSTIEDFMQQFSDPSQPQCLETPTELWD